LTKNGRSPTPFVRTTFQILLFYFFYGDGEGGRVCGGRVGWLGGRGGDGVGGRERKSIFAKWPLLPLPEQKVN
jgi:hypothetical protein